MKSLSLLSQVIGAALFLSGTYAQAQQILPSSVNKSAVLNGKQPDSLNLNGSASQLYIIRLDDPSVAQYNGDKRGFSATNPKVTVQQTKLNKPRELKLDISSSDVKAYRQYLQQQQQSVLSKIAQLTGQHSAKQQFQYAINGMVLELTPAQASQVRKLPGIKSVEADKKLTLNTDTSPALTGAHSVWDGATLEGINALGENTVIAIFDTGINTDHPSFAATGGDGYLHSNPLGSGNYLGDCATDFPTLCNDKLIGVYSYSQITNDYSDTDIFPPGLPRNGEDYNGHGSHVASTAAGNILYNVPSVGLAYDLEQSDGYTGDFTFAQISGIAPHANIISFQICSPGENDDQYNGCYTNLAIRAIDDAIATGIVDAINYSISGGEEVWGDTLSEAWLSANNAGIFVAHSAGNDGPGSSTSDKLSPWITPVAATSHGRTLDLSKSIGDFSGGLSTPAFMNGQSNTGAITANIVYAGNYPNANDPDGDPAQCLEPYPAGTFNGEIVVCDRGDIARIQKAINVAQGGAGGYVLANVTDEADNLVADEYVIPGIHISATDGDNLKTWLASGSDHRATISATAGIRSVDSSLADRIASFSSRGPNSEFSILLPMISAPGVDIYAAYSDEHYGHETTGPAPADYAYLDGTSMASPHVAGAALLLRQLHPNWSADAIRSALMMTAITDVTTDGQTEANWLDMGSGRIQIDAAANAGLIIEESQSNYLAANPLRGGDPKTLNIPALVDNNCLIQCSWQRTVTATRDGSWTLSLDDMDSGLALTAQPASFSLSAGQSQTISFTLSAWNTAENGWAFANVLFDSGDPIPLHIPVAVIASNGNFPQEISQNSYRDSDSLLLKDLLAIEITDFTYATSTLTRATERSATVAQDSSENEIFDDITDGVFALDVTVDEDSPRFIVQLTASSAPDLDLYIGFDSNSDGTFEEDELVALSAGLSWDEFISIESPEAGNYRIYVHNYTSSDAENDSFTLSYAVVGSSNDGTLSLDAPASVALRESFDMRLLWTLDASLPGDRYYGNLILGSSPQTPANLGNIPVEIYRDNNDVQLEVIGADRLSPGDSVDYRVNVGTNNTNEDRDYEIDVTLPEGTSVVTSSVTNGGVVNGNTISWSLTQNISSQSVGYIVSSPESDNHCAIPAAKGSRYIDLSALGYKPVNHDSTDMLAAFPVPFDFMGEQWRGLAVSSKGYIMPAASSSNITSPGVNRTLANGAIPTSILAPLWRDWSFDNSSTSGITVATLNSDITVIEWSGLQSEGVSADIEVILNHGSTDNEPAVIFAYQNVSSNIDHILTGTVGWQNQSGKFGETLAFDTGSGNALTKPVSSLVKSGSIICLTTDNTTTAVGPAALNFSLEVATDSTLTGAIPVAVSSEIPNIPGTQQEIGEVNTQVEMHAAPQLLINGSDQASISLTELQSAVLPITVSDANGDALTLSVEQLSGPTATINVSGEVVRVTPAAADQGTTLRLQVTATDEYGFSASATVTITVTEPAGGGGGGSFSFMWLGGLLVIVCCRRRRIR